MWCWSVRQPQASWLCPENNQKAWILASLYMFCSMFVYVKYYHPNLNLLDINKKQYKNGAFYITTQCFRVNSVSFLPLWFTEHKSTCISWMIALNWGDRSVHCFSSSIALSKFFTYSAYILRKGVSFCRMSPMRGVDDLQEGRRRWIPHWWIALSLLIGMWKPYQML